VQAEWIQKCCFWQTSLLYRLIWCWFWFWLWLYLNIFRIDSVKSTTLFALNHSLRSADCVKTERCFNESWWSSVRWSISCMLFLHLLLCLLWCFAFDLWVRMKNENISSERRIIVTDLDLVTDLLFHLLKFEVFWLIRSFLMFSYFDTLCFDTWYFSTLMLFYIDFFHSCFDLCTFYVCMLSWATAYAAACWSLCQSLWLSKSGGWDCCI